MEFIAVLAAVLFFGWLIISASRKQEEERARQELQQRAEQQTAEACSYIAEVSRAGAFPTVWMSNVNIQKGEFGVLHESATLFELRTSRVSLGMGTRVRIGKMPIYLGSSQSIPVEDLRPVGEGDLYLSNQRLLFLSSSRSATVALKDVLGVDASLDALTMHSAKRQKPLVFTVANPAKWSLLIKLLAGEHLESPALPSGLTLKAEPSGTPGEINISAQRATNGYPATA